MEKVKRQVRTMHLHTSTSVNRAMPCTLTIIIGTHHHAHPASRSFFHGVHLRVEEDAAIWHGMFGGELPYWRAYSREATRLGLGDAPVYIATGAWESTNQTLVKVRCGLVMHPVIPVTLPVTARHACKTRHAFHTRCTNLQGVRRWGKRYGTQVFHKGVVLPESVWKQLNSEQIALVELLILVRVLRDNGHATTHQYAITRHSSCRFGARRLLA